MDTAIRIDLLPAGVHYCYPTRSDLQGGAHLVRECPTEAIRHAVDHPRLSKEAIRRTKSYAHRGLGPSPFALLHGARLAGEADPPPITRVGGPIPALRPRYC